jgi:glycosyltransferase involved in cell wall biosynthesis
MLGAHLTERGRPLVTFALFAYNQERFIREAVEGAFAQTYSPLEIVLSDDHSTDATFEILTELSGAYSGPHRLVVRRNSRNLGLVAHMDAVAKISMGQVFVVAAGDDVSVPERTSRIVDDYLSSEGRFVALYSALTGIDERSNEMESQKWRSAGSSDVLAMAAGPHGIFGCSAAYTADIFKRFDAIASEVVHEDLVLPFRAAMCGEVRFVDSPLVRYRLHESNIWNRASTQLTKKEYLRRQAKCLPNEVGVARQRLADLERARLDRLLDGVESRRLGGLIRKQLRRSQLELNVMRGVGSLVGCSSVGKLLLGASTFKRGVRWAYVRFLPEMKWLNRALLR